MKVKKIICKNSFSRCLTSMRAFFLSLSFLLGFVFSELMSQNPKRNMKERPRARMGERNVRMKSCKLTCHNFYIFSYVKSCSVKSCQSCSPAISLVIRAQASKTLGPLCSLSLFPSPAITLFFGGWPMGREQRRTPRSGTC